MPSGTSACNAVKPTSLRSVSASVSTCRVRLQPDSVSTHGSGLTATFINEPDISVLVVAPETGGQRALGVAPGWPDLPHRGAPARQWLCRRGAWSEASGASPPGQ